VKASTKARRALLGTLLAGTTVLATGCSTGGMSLASMNPFSAANPSAPGAASTVTESIASTAGGARNQISTLGTTAKSAWGKTTGAVAGVFGAKPPAEGGPGSAPDPLRLDTPVSISPEVFVANGQLWESTGDLKKAMESYVKALENEPNHPPALTSIARLHFRQGNHRKAAEFFEKAISQSPEDAGLHNDMGLTLSKLGKHNEAGQSLQRALELSPGTSRYANNLASVKFESGDVASAYTVLAANNKPAVAHFNMAYLHFKRGQVNDARGHLGMAIQFEPQAATDTAVKRAVERSRDMLAQIDGNLSPIAQAAPQAQIAGLPSGKTTIQQASQSQTPGTSPHVAPASQVSSPPSWTAPMPTTNQTVPNSTTAPVTAPVPTKPADATTSAPVISPASPSGGFSLPSSFGSTPSE
jgi:Tfp pilus assembly protein PilF